MIVQFKQGNIQARMSINIVPILLLFSSLVLLPPAITVHLHHMWHSNEYLNEIAAAGEIRQNNGWVANDAANLNLNLSTSGLEEDACQKLWMYGLNGTCLCRSSVHDSVSCSNISYQVAVLRCHCMTYDSAKGVIVGSCPYGCGYFNESLNWSKKIYRPLPLNISDLNHGMCGRLNRDYRLCSKCSKGFCPLAYSYDLNCVKCKSKYNWLKYVTIAYVPLTIFYFIVILFRIDATEPYLYGFITLNQGLASPANLRAVFMTVTGKIALTLRIITIPYATWNLDFFRSLSLNICLDLTTLQTLALDYAIAIYPLLLVVVTYIAIELHDRGCKLLVWLWRPFHGCCVRFSRVVETKASVVKAFATFLLLSYVKFINTTIDILLPGRVYNSSGEPFGWYVYYDASYKYFGSKHLPFCILSIGFFLVFVFAPLVLLFLYPMSFFQRCLSTCRLRSHTLHTFIDAFQGHYKDGIEPGTRDCRWFASAYFLGRIIIFNVIFGITQDVLCYGLTGIFILLVVIVTVVLQPYRSAKVNNYHISLQLVLAIASFLIALLDQASIKDNWLMHLINYMIGMISILPIVIAIIYTAYKLRHKLQSVLRMVLGNCSKPTYMEDEDLSINDVDKMTTINSINNYGSIDYT